MLSPDDPLNHGIESHIAGETYGHYVGYDPDLGQWTLLVSATDTRADRNVVVTSTSPVTEVEAIGFTADASAASDRFFLNNNGSYVLATAEAGFTESSSARSVAAGDFDNDADVDLYVVSTGPIQNNPNILYLNDGTGVFTKAIEHGAEGPIEGRGDSASMADFNNDGFLDLFVSNGKDKSPFYLDGPYVLFRNLGNDNHWVQMDLIGTVSEIQGIGSTIVTTTNGVSQIRIHGNDTNGRSQHMIRSHFGLADASIIDEIHVTWPSGHEKKLQAVAVDQILTIVEPETQFDSDADGLADSVDNCLNTSNPNQLDSDMDGFGNVCDADFDNSCSVNFIDFSLLSEAFLGTEAVFDLNADGTVNFLDIAIFVDAFFGSAGSERNQSFFAQAKNDLSANY